MNDDGDIVGRFDDARLLRVYQMEREQGGHGTWRRALRLELERRHLQVPTEKMGLVTWDSLYGPAAIVLHSAEVRFPVMGSVGDEISCVTMAVMN